MSEIASAYVQIIPSAQGISSSLSSELSGEMSKSGTSAASSFSKAFKAAAITVVAAAVKKAVSAVIDAGSEYETAMAQVSTIMDETVMSTDEMSEAILELSTEMGVAATEIAESVYNAISATGDTANAVELVAQATKLATAGFTDTESALSVLTTAINAYGLEATEAESISDSLIMVQNLGVTTVEELASSMGKAIATASAYNVDLGNLESAYVSLTKAGISTEESTTYLSSMLNELGDSSSDVAAILQEETGMSFGQLMEDGYSLADVLAILNESVDGDSEALMNLWSSAEAGKASSAIVGQGLETFNENLQAITDSAGATQEAYETMTNTLEYQTERLSNAGTNLMIALYEGMSSQLTNIASFGADVVTEMITAYETDGVSGLLNVGIDAIGQILNGMVEAIPNAITGIGDIIVQILESFTTALTENDGGSNIGVEIFNGIVSGLAESLPEIATAALDLVTALATYIVESIPVLVEAAASLMLNFVNAIVETDWMTLGSNIIAGIVEGLTGAIETLIASAQSIGNTILDTIKSLFGIASPSTVMSEIGGYLVDGLIEGLAAMPENLISSLESAVSGVTSWGSDLVSDFTSIGKNVINGLINGIDSMVSSLYSSIKSSLSGLVDKAKNALGIGSPSKVFRDEVGQWIPAGIGEGVESGSVNLSTTIEDALYSTVSSAQLGVTASLSANDAQFASSVGGRNVSGGYTQNITINSPTALTASEIARQTRNSTRNMVLSLMGA